MTVKEGVDMFIIIENYANRIDTYCRMLGPFDREDEARAVMHGRYLTEKDAHDYKLDWNYFDDDEARLCWQGNEDWYDWHIFEVKKPS